MRYDYIYHVPSMRVERAMVYNYHDDIWPDRLEWSVHKYGYANDLDDEPVEHDEDDIIWGTN